MAKRLEDILKKNKGGDGFFVGDKMTAADIHFFTSMEWFLMNGHEGALDSFPKLKALKERVASNEAIAAYLAKRKPTAM